MILRIRYDCVDFSQVVLVPQHKHKAECENACDVDAQRNQEHKKKPIVSTSNTVVNPWAVVIKCLKNNNPIHFNICGYKAEEVSMIFILKLYTHLNSTNSLNLGTFGKPF